MSKNATDYLEGKIEEDGSVNPEDMAMAIFGTDDSLDEGEEEVTTDDTADDESTEEDSSTSLDADQEKTVDDPELQGEVEGEEPVVLAKDGKNTIPYSELVEKREAAAKAEERANEAEQKAADLQRELDEQKQAFLDQEAAIKKQMEEAVKADEEAGNTEATEELLADLDEEFPETGKIIRNLLDKVNKLESREKEQEQAAQKRIDDEAADKALDDAIEKLSPSYKEYRDSQEFWNWYNKEAPEHVRAAGNSMDPKSIATIVIPTYELLNPPAKGSDKPKGNATKIDKEKVDKAILDASNKSSVQSLTDVPTTSSSFDSTEEAINNLADENNAIGILDRIENMDPEEIKDLLQRTA